MIASETRNHCAAVVMDLSTRANNSDGSGGGGGGDSGGGDSGNGRRRNGAAGGRPAKSVFSIRSLVGEDTSTATASSAVQQHRREPDENRGNDRTPQRPRHRRDRRRDDAQRCDDGESWVTFFSLVTRARTRARGSIILIIISIDISFGFVQNVQRLLLIAIAVTLFYTGRYLCRIDFHRFDRVRTGLRHDPPPSPCADRVHQWRWCSSKKTFRLARRLLCVCQYTIFRRVLGNY